MRALQEFLKSRCRLCSYNFVGAGMAVYLSWNCLVAMPTSTSAATAWFSIAICFVLGEIGHVLYRLACWCRRHMRKKPKKGKGELAKSD
mmetsp:Transcript_23651/g.35482  ORF Transcript_23651/g.35482 Transcript_23651/m.35482 type:complete len:89 (+) Transcript_23651:3-269(+)